MWLDWAHKHYGTLLKVLTPLKLQDKIILKPFDALWYSSLYLLVSLYYPPLSFSYHIFIFRTTTYLSYLRAVETFWPNGQRNAINTLLEIHDHSDIATES